MWRLIIVVHAVVTRPAVLPTGLERAHAPLDFQGRQGTINGTDVLHAISGVYMRQRNDSEGLQAQASSLSQLSATIQTEAIFDLSNEAPTPQRFTLHTRTTAIVHHGQCG